MSVKHKICIFVEQYGAMAFEEYIVDASSVDFSDRGFLRFYNDAAFIRLVHAVPKSRVIKVDRIEEEEKEVENES